jgi:hypothetical protein
MSRRIAAKAHRDQASPATLYFEVPDGADSLHVSSKKETIFKLPLDDMKVTPGVSAPFLDKSIPPARRIGIVSGDFVLHLTTANDEDGAALLSLVGVEEDDEDLTENAFSNTAPVKKRASKKEPGVATLMHGGMDLTAHFSHKPSQEVKLVLKNDDLLQVHAGGTAILDMPLVEITDVYVGVMSPVLKEKKDVDNSSAFTIKGGGMELNLEAENSDKAVQWLDGLKQALQARSQEIVVNPIEISR